MSKDTTQFVGMRLREVKSLVPLVRVTQAGKVRFTGTADYKKDRLNVVLGAENLEFTKVQRDDMVVEKVVGSMDEGIVCSARWG